MFSITPKQRDCFYMNRFSTDKKTSLRPALLFFVHEQGAKSAEVLGEIFAGP
jgi:hypothetical protein